MSDGSNTDSSDSSYESGVCVRMCAYSRVCVCVCIIFLRVNYMYARVYVGVGARIVRVRACIHCAYPCRWSVWTLHYRPCTE